MSYCFLFNNEKIYKLQKFKFFFNLLPDALIFELDHSWKPYVLNFNTRCHLFISETVGLTVKGFLYATPLVAQGYAKPLFCYIIKACLSVCPFDVYPCILCSTYDVAMKFSILMSYGPKTNAIGNGLDFHFSYNVLF